MRTTYATRSITTGSVRQSKRYWYYVSKPVGPEDKRPVDRLPAGPLEGIVREAVMLQLANRAWVADALTTAGSSPEDLDRFLAKAEHIGNRHKHRSDEEDGLSMRALLRRIALGDGALTITIDLASLLERTGTDPVLAPAVLVPMLLRRNGRNRPIVLHTDTGAPRRDAPLIVLVADARRWMDEVLDGPAQSVAEITERKQLRPGAVSRILPLAWLAPDIATSILEGRQPTDLTVRRLKEMPELPLDWSDQRRILGFVPH